MTAHVQPLAGPPPSPADARLVAAIRRALAEAADPVRAAGAQAYMKSAMPFRGVTAPAQRALYRAAFAAHLVADASTWRATALTLWREAAYREERYAAIELTGAKRYAAFQALDTVPMYEEMIVTGAWWDFVDAIASHRIGALVAAFPARMKPLMRRWSRDEDMWRRRTAILCQLTFKERTDLDLLYACIEPNLADTEFFIRKAIGWALRQYAWTDPREVARYVRAHERKLGALSRREAMKNISGPRR
jgi:3-methyladenine DNA glycosylase AlkD